VEQISHLLTTALGSLVRVAERAAAFDHEHHYSVKLYSSLEAGVETVRAAVASRGMVAAWVTPLHRNWPVPERWRALKVPGACVRYCKWLAQLPTFWFGRDIHRHRFIAAPPFLCLSLCPQAQSAVSAVKDRISAASDSVREGVHSARDGISSAAETAGAALSGPLHAASARVSTVAGACTIRCRCRGCGSGGRDASADASSRQTWCSEASLASAHRRCTVLHDHCCLLTHSSFHSPAPCA
jgi:hypothetical protein